MNLKGNNRLELQTNGYTVVRRDQFGLTAEDDRALADFRSEYARMPEDPHLNPSEGDRFRRYARFAIDPRTLELSLFPHDRFFQSKTYDVLYGDIHRNFSPMTFELVRNRFFLELLKLTFRQFPEAILINESYEISVHMIRIAATVGNRRGRPAPEGIHRDGYHFAAIHLMERHNLCGAENRIYNLNKEIIFRTHLTAPLDSIYLDDRKVFHGVESFTGTHKDRPAYRDILILLYQPLSESPQPTASPGMISV